MAPRKLNQKDYTHYVVVFRNGQPLIESGWEFREDANDNVREIREATPKIKVKVLSRRAMPVDPDDNDNWLKGPYTGP